MRVAILVFTSLTVVSGCVRPLMVRTANRVLMDGVVQTNNRVVAEMPLKSGGHVVAVPLAAMPCEGPKIAILDVDGLLLNQDFTGPYSAGENPVALFREKLEAVAADPQVQAVLLRINTPGGSVTATDILWHDLLAFRKRTHLPVVACLLDVAAGGGYYLATAADVIVAHPTTVTGGIGVILNLYNLDELMGQFNIRPREVKSGKFIDLGSPTRNLTEEAEALLAKMAREYHDRFKQVVLKARPAVNTDESTFDGRVFTAREAQERGLVDQLGYLDDAVALAAEMGHCQDAMPVLYRRKNDPARSLYEVTPNVPLQATLIPFSVPGLDRSKMPAFLYLWQPEATLPRLSGR